MTDEEIDKITEKAAEKAVEKFAENNHKHCLLAQQVESFEDISTLVRLIKLMRRAESIIGRWIILTLLGGAALLLGFLGYMKLGK